MEGPVHSKVILHRKTSPTSSGSPEHRVPPPLPPKDTDLSGDNATFLASRFKPLPLPEYDLNPAATLPPLPPTISRSNSEAPPRTRTIYPRYRNYSEPPEIHEYIDCAQEEVRRQARLKAEKEESLQQYIQEENHRRHILEGELRYAAQLKKQREQKEREAEAERQRAEEVRKKAERERRIEQGRVLQAFEEQSAKRAQELDKSKVEARERRNRARCNRTLSTLPTHEQSNQAIFSGWVTLQDADALTWKRRYCSAHHRELRFAKNYSETSPISETLQMKDVTMVADQGDEFQGLELLPCAFGVQMRDGKSFVIICESPEQKEDLISLVMQLSNA